jgi:hypothetical protein
MNTQTFIAINLDGSEIEHIQINHNNGSITTMLKSTYDEHQAALSTPMVTDDPKP